MQSTTDHPGKMLKPHKYVHACTIEQDIDLAAKQLPADSFVNLLSHTHTHTHTLYSLNVYHILWSMKHYHNRKHNRYNIIYNGSRNNSVSTIMQINA